MMETSARPVTRGPEHHFFGYYDKSPWDAQGRRMLALATPFSDREPGPDDVATVGVIDLTQQSFAPCATTAAWNWQQGTMLQWLGPGYDRWIAFNERQGERFVAVLLDLESGTRRVLSRPIYAVSPDGAWALSLSFARLHRLRRGYGYADVEDHRAAECAPADDGIYLTDLASGESRLIISLAQIAAFSPEAGMSGQPHWVNHLQISTDGRRFAFLHRWRQGESGWHTRLFTAARDGSAIRCLSDHEMISHYDWRDGEHLLAWARRHGSGDRYYLFGDGTASISAVGDGVLTSDGHCSFSPDRQWLLTDTYPDDEQMRTLILYHFASGRRLDIGRFLSPASLAGPCRCDLHPRWRRDGRQVCIDSAHAGERQMYVVDVAAITAA